MNPDMQVFLSQHQLPEKYALEAEKFFAPVAKALIESRQRISKTQLIALNGAQGSGKTTLGDYLCFYLQEQGFKALSLSLDDFYLSKANRKKLAENIHPLLATRGVPGTHNTELLETTLKALKSGRKGFRIPRFDKAQDDCVPESDLDQVVDFYDFVILEGWCWGAIHEDGSQLLEPVNDLEAEEDAHGEWRRFVNQKLELAYEPLYKLMDVWLMLRAPSFDCVYQWRLEQEEKLAQAYANKPASEIMTEEQVARFIKHYERITRHVLKTLPKTADLVWELDAQRHIKSIVRNGGGFNVSI